MSEGPVVERLRQFCMALPEAHEEPFGGHTAPCWRVRGKHFVMVSEDLSQITFKGQPGAQGILVGSQPEVFFVPRYTGHKGWIGVRLASNFSWDTIEGLIFESWAMTAPKALVKAAAR
jgi:hypothetical protein